MNEIVLTDDHWLIIKLQVWILIKYFWIESSSFREVELGRREQDQVLIVIVQNWFLKVEPINS